MKAKYIKNVLICLGIFAVSYGGYQWDKSRKLNNYFVEQFSLDWQLQSMKGDPGHDGPIGEQAYAEMKELGYNPCEIQKIMFKGFDKGHKKVVELQKAEEKTK